MPEGMALIRWSHHHTTVQALFATLRQSGELADMTVTNGATSLRCHRLVLSAACPNFLKLLKKCSGDVVLYLGAVHSAVLEALVQYMYCGSVHIDRCRLNEFVQLATQWGVRGVCGREGVSITRTGCASDAVGGTVAEPRSSPPPPPSPPALSATSLSALKDDVSQLPPADNVSRRPLPGAASRVGGGGGSCASDASDQQRQAVAPPPSHRTRHSSMDTSDSDSEKRLNPSMMSDLSCSVRPQTARAAAGSGSARKKMEKSAKLSAKKTKSATKKAKSTSAPKTPHRVRSSLARVTETSSAAGKHHRQQQHRQQQQRSGQPSRAGCMTLQALAANILPMYKCPHCVRPKFVQPKCFERHMWRVHGDDCRAGGDAAAPNIDQHRSYSPDRPAVTPLQLSLTPSRHRPTSAASATSLPSSPRLAPSLARPARSPAVGAVGGSADTLAHDRQRGPAASKSYDQPSVVATTATATATATADADASIMSQPACTVQHVPPVTSSASGCDQRWPELIDISH